MDDSLPLGRALRSQPDTRVLLAALQTGPDADLLAEVERANAAGVEWNQVLELARAHRVLPQLLRTLGPLPTTPTSVRADLLNGALRNARRQSRLASALDDVLATLRERDIPALALKGPSLSLWLYGDAHQRMSRDLDVLIAPEFVYEAVGAVVAAGFEAAVPGMRRLSPQEAAVVVRDFVLKDVSYFHPGLRIALELHWRPYRLPGLSRLSQALQAGLTTHVSEDGRWAFADDAARAAYVLAHGAAHGYRRLGWLVDAARLAERIATDTWGEVLALASEDGAEPFVLLGPFLAERLFGTVFPDPVRERLQQRERRLARLALRCSMTSPQRDEMSPDLLRLSMALFDSPPDRVRVAWEYLTAPAEGELPAANLRETPTARLLRRMARPRRLASRLLRLQRTPGHTRENHMRPGKSRG